MLPAVDPTEAIAMAEKPIGGKDSAPAVADWLAHPVATSHKITQAEKWAAEPQWQGPPEEVEP
jgi:hypothetical protein